MTTLFQAYNSETATTHNGMGTFASSLDKAVDLFFMIGSSRGQDITAEFVAAFAEQPEVAVRVLMWARDARGGSGERDTFLKLMDILPIYDAEIANKVLEVIPTIGRWSDLVNLLDTPALEKRALELIVAALKAEDALCAKWMPRPSGSAFNKRNANKIRKALGMTPKEYRLLLRNLSTTVEQQICANEWEEINFSHVPSVAAARYQKAFSRHAPEQYSAYKEALNTGEAKINASVVYPYDVVQSVKFGDTQVANAQWAALPNYLEGSDDNILPIVDVSGSMSSMVGDNPNLSCMDIAISLGLYLAERTEGVFKDQFMTFSTQPSFVQLAGNTLQKRYDQMKRADWGMSTNLEAVFTTLLDAAVSHSVPVEQMPTKLLIVSDMEFNAASVERNYQPRWNGMRDLPVLPNVKAMDVIETLYAQAGYAIPQIVFWNVKARSGNVPATSGKEGVALISGFSPAIMESILSGGDFTPRGIMLEAVMKDRYNIWG